MRLHYKKAMEHLNPSPDTLENILNQTRKPKIWRSPRRTLGMAAAACAAVVLLSTGVASAYGHFFHNIPSDVVGSLKPVQLTCTSQDITMTVQDASVVDGTLAVYLTLEDISGGDRMANNVDFHHSYDVNRPEDTMETSYRYQSLGYDEESHTHGFLVTITPTTEDKKPLFLPNQTFTLSVEQLLLAQENVQLILSPDWSSLPAEPDRNLRTCHYWGYVNNYRRQIRTSSNEAEVLLPGSWELPLTDSLTGDDNFTVNDSFTVTAAGFLDSGLHIQVRHNHRDSDFDFVNLVLVMADGSIIGNALGPSGSGHYCHLGFYDEYNYEYREFIFDVSPEDLAGASLRGDFTCGGYLLDGDWEVTFSLEQEEAEADSAQYDAEQIVPDMDDALSDQTQDTLE